MAEEALRIPIGSATDTVVTPFSLRLIPFNREPGTMDLPPVLDAAYVSKMSLPQLLFYVLIENGGVFRVSENVQTSA